MGYDIHITRKENWFDDDGHAISIEEWLHLLANDPEMRMDEAVEATTPDGSTIRMESEGLAVWLAHLSHQRDGTRAWFNYHGGNISVKNPDKETLMKMWLIAQQLSAAVQGDEGEFYDRNGEPG